MTYELSDDAKADVRRIYTDMVFQELVASGPGNTMQLIRTLKLLVEPVRRDDR